MQTNQKEKFVQIIKDIRFAMLTTIDSNGQLHSRPMANLQIKDSESFNGILYFFTKLDSLKVNDIKKDKDVNLSYANPDSLCFVSVTGKASLENDSSKLEDLWEPSLISWFPDGLSDSELALIKVQVESAKIWEAPSANSLHTHSKLQSNHQHFDMGDQY